MKRIATLFVLIAAAVVLGACAHGGPHGSGCRTARTGARRDGEGATVLQRDLLVATATRTASATRSPRSPASAPAARSWPAAT